MIKVDKEFKYLLKSSWICKHRERVFVWISDSGKHGKYLSRVIMELHIGRKLLRTEIVDHKNRNKFDNRLNNLRICTHAQNIRNQSRKGKSKGVTKTENGKWVSRITYNKKLFTLGTFKKKTDAIKAYNLASIKYHGEYGRQNGQ